MKKFQVLMFVTHWVSLFYIPSTLSNHPIFSRIGCLVYFSNYFISNHLQTKFPFLKDISFQDNIFSIYLTCLIISQIMLTFIKFISKKIMRNKDFAAVKSKTPGYRRFFVKGIPATLYRTPRGWFFNDLETKKSGEVSVTTAQKILNEWGIKFNTGW